MADQPAQPPSAERAGLGGGMNPGTPQGLVGVDVADARHQPLVHQRRLDGRSPAAELTGEQRRQVRVQSVGAEATQSGVAGGSPRGKPDDRSETAWVDQRHHGPPDQLDLQVRVGRGRGSPVPEAEPAGHAEVDRQRAALGDREQQPFAVPGGLEETAPGQSLAQLGWTDRPPQPHLCGADHGHRPTGKAAGQSAANGLDLGKLRHTAQYDAVWKRSGTLDE